MGSRFAVRLAVLLAVAAIVLGLLPSAGPLAGLRPESALANHTPNPTAVTIAGSLQSELGCTGDWDPGCAATHLAYDGNDDVWQEDFDVPAGNHEYKAPLNNDWPENYGLHAIPGGPNIPLSLGADTSVKFYYDHKSHWITDSYNSVIAVAPGSFQSELGCPGDWDPGCLRSWLQDIDGDGIYRFETTALPAASYEGKVALNESWDVNYGQGGVQNGPNIHFTVPVAGAKVTFTYDSASHVLTILAGHAADGNVEWDGLRHDSRDTLYRTPGGAVADGTGVRLRFRTFHNDVTSVKARIYSLNLGGQQIVPMSIAAADVSCYQSGLESETCDFWEMELAADMPAPGPDNFWYRFIVADGGDTDYYGDNTTALDGGLGAASDDPIDYSWALMRYVGDFSAPDWAQDAVIYQIFPDRFRNGRKDNDLKTGTVRYDDPVIKLPWGALPEGYCRNYANSNDPGVCPWRFDDTPPDWSFLKEQPRGRDYYGGDLKGVDQQLDYLASIGVTAIYFNPVFDAGSNHSYDTQDYTQLDPAFGTARDWDNLVKHADEHGIRVILDGVFNHLSSDSPFFDRYHHYTSSGACESPTSAYRDWFTFHDVAVGTGTCVSSTGVANSATYDGWFGFDSIPVITKSNTEVLDYFLNDDDAIAKQWLEDGAAGWRMDVSGDASFPAGYWETFRDVVKDVDPDALTISETWQKDSTLLRMLRGDRLDTTMNYRFRDAVIGLLTPGAFDSKGFGDSGRIIAPSEFAARLSSIREDYPDAAYYALMNLLDSHDTERLLWTLTPGVETQAEKEQNAANVANGKLRVRLASLIQFTVPGAPTVYYGDEVGLTGDDDPDDRRTFPWADLGGSPDNALKAHYTELGDLREELDALRAGDFRVLLADDAAETVAYGRKTGAAVAIVALNRSAGERTLTINVAEYLPNGITFLRRYGVGVAAAGSVRTSGGQLVVTLPAWSGLLLATGAVDLTPPAAPANLAVTGEAANALTVEWDAVTGAAGYDVYASPLRGGGYVKANGAPVVGTEFTITGLPNAREAFVVVRALDAIGNASAPSNEASGLPHPTIGWANLQWPPSMSHTISAVDRTDTAYGQVWIDGFTSQPGPTPGLRAQLGFGPDGSNPDDNAAWTWVEAAFNVDAGNNDEFQASMLPEATGTFDYAYRYTVTNGRDWLYADLDGAPNGYSPAQAGDLVVNSSGDTTAPAAPANLHVVSASPAGIELAWDAVLGDATLYGYEVRRGSTPGGPYATIGFSSSPAFTDSTVDEGATYVYVVRSVDLSFNRSGPSNEVQGTAELRTVTVTFTVTVPASTDATGRPVTIAGTLTRLDGGFPDWTPGVAELTRLDATHWQIVMTGLETTGIEYKYVIRSDSGDAWAYVEKDGACGEIGNRQLTLSYGATGTQAVNDTVQNWRNVAPCGN